MTEKTVQAHGLAVTQAKDIKQSSLALTVDAVIVGSGAGGAVMAYELAKTGKKVVVLEAGPYIPSEQFQEKFVHALETLYQDKGGQGNVDGDLLILQGRCVGGSTVVNGTVCFRTPDYILADWQRDHGLKNLTVDALNPYFDKVEKRLTIHENQEHEINRNSSLLRDGANKLGVSWKPFKRNIRNCALTGHCLSGCATDRKQSMLVTYLPWAVAEGAQIFADTHVQKVLQKDGKASGVSADIIDPVSGKKVADLQVSAKVVVLAAGAIQTPVLLQKSELANSSGQVGKNFACHPSLYVAGKYKEDVHAWRGAMLGVYVDEWEHPSKGGFVLEGGGAGPIEFSSVAHPGFGGDFLRYMEESKKLAGIVTLIHDHNVGEIQWDGEKQKIEYKLADADFTSMKAALKAATKLHLAAGAEKVYLPTVAQMEVSRPEDVDSVVDGISENQPHVFRMVSYHPQGSCRMGSDPAKSVVNPYGETHDVQNLFVADASLLPTSIIVNPQVTVYTLSSYIADNLLKNAEKHFA